MLGGRVRDVMGWPRVYGYVCGLLSSACVASSAAPPPPVPRPPPPVPFDDPKTCIDPAGDFPSPGSPETERGHLEPELIRNIARQHYGELTSCYSAGLGRHPQLTGTVRIRFAIERDGKVSHSRVSDGTNLP